VQTRGKDNRVKRKRPTGRKNADEEKKGRGDEFVDEAMEDLTASPDSRKGRGR